MPSDPPAWQVFHEERQPERFWGIFAGISACRRYRKEAVAPVSQPESL